MHVTEVLAKLIQVRFKTKAEKNKKERKNRAQTANEILRPSRKANKT